MTALAAIDGPAVRRWYRLAADALAQAGPAIDALNVFPVPDADTGTNLQLTLAAAARAVDEQPGQAGAAQLWQAAARGALAGACGNSGIIVSQLLRGLSDVCAPAPRCDARVLAAAFAHAARLARAAVSRPVEGTVLTVADAAAAAAAVALAGPPPGDELPGVVTAAALGARTALARTSEQLDVLAASGVVDAGAAGLCVLLDVLTATVTGQIPAGYLVPAPDRRARTARTRPDGLAGPAAPAAAPGPGGASHYEVTYLLDAAAAAVGELRERLNSLGDSVVIAGAGRSWHVHVHLADAGAAVEAGLRAGRPSRITVTFLGPAGPVPPGPGPGPLGTERTGTERTGPGLASAGSPGAARAGRAVVAIAAGDGAASLLLGAGARVIRQDGDTAPAVAALLAEASQAGQELIFLPNGYAQLTAAQSAATRLSGEGRAVAVVGSRSPVQALAAMAVHDPARSFQADVAAMDRAAAGMRYGSLIRQGDSLAGLVADEVAATGTDEVTVAICVAEALMADGGELVTLMAAGAADAPLVQAVAAHLARRWPAAEIVRYGGGPVPLLIGVE